MKKIVLAIMLFHLLPSSPVQATTMNSRQMLGTCMPTTLSICGISIPVPGNTTGSTMTIALPDRFENTSVLVQCVANRDSNFYMVMQNAPNICALKSCKPPATVDVCNTKLPIDRLLQLDEVRKFTVPAAYLAPSKKSVLSTFSAKCSMKDGAATYEVVNTSGVSCNDFPCEPAVLKICNHTVTLSGTSELGQVIRTVTEQQKPVTVQCLGSGGNRPIYQVTDSSQAGCDQ